jgi:hypothetical protein
MGTGSFPGVKRSGRGVEHPPTSCAKVTEGVKLYFYSPSGPSWPDLWWTLPFSGSKSVLFFSVLFYVRICFLSRLNWQWTFQTLNTGQLQISRQSGRVRKCRCVVWNYCCFFFSLSDGGRSVIRIKTRVWCHFSAVIWCCCHVTDGNEKHPDRQTDIQTAIFLHHAVSEANNFTRWHVYVSSWHSMETLASLFHCRNVPGWLTTSNMVQASRWGSDNRRRALLEKETRQ